MADEKKEGQELRPEPQIFPVVNGERLEKIKYLDYGTIRVVFDAKSGVVIGVMKASKRKEK